MAALFRGRRGPYEGYASLDTGAGQIALGLKACLRPARRLFVTQRAPITGLSTGCAIVKTVTRALSRAGIVSERKGGHLFRHTLATEMLGRGASLREIGEVLRHWKVDTTRIYAKVDLRVLRNSDVNLAEGLVTIRESKFGKSGVVPLHPTTVKALATDKVRRDAFLKKAETFTFFISERRGSISSLHKSFREICRVAGLEKRRNGIRPTMHDLRHTLAVQTLLAWYHSGSDVERHLPILSNFLGHSHVENTYSYLSSTPEKLVGQFEFAEWKPKNHLRHSPFIHYMRTRTLAKCGRKPESVQFSVSSRFENDSQSCPNSLK